MDMSNPPFFDATGLDSAALLRRADALQARARQVVADLGLADRWGRVGRVAEVGSSRFGLLVSPNLDFEIYVEQPEIGVGFEVIRDMARTPGVAQVVYLNFLGTADPGLYWRIDFRDAAGELWDIDQWLVPNDHPHAGVAETLAAAMQRALTDETRRAILEIKASRSEPPKYRGIDVYRAVLRDRVRTPAEFVQWLAAHPSSPETIETWHP